MEEEWEEEEQLVVVELSGVINNDFLSKGKGTCKILDIDSEKPMMQVGQYVFAGEYEDTLGTCVLFEEVPPTGKENHQDLKYMCHTVKKLMMQRIFLTDKKEMEIRTVGDGDSGDGGDSGEQNNTTCQSIEENNDDNKQEDMEEDMNNIDLEDSATS
ncbi:general transcription factor 3C polypeptide 6 [Parambassis ranga]|uniref:General transcription factor 3C polypeptide 6 n=1 Tax=Parambassis ranga TaxID=210632 RepID=A0A6P7K9P4_9TELE|nr:general transcription factor 3C polypeptide 6 [Parambassis ranga]XP_028286146.1 general transcription factor 3C polypeptide 6 [Parambassis ranga]